MAQNFPSGDCLLACPFLYSNPRRNPFFSLPSFPPPILARVPFIFHPNRRSIFGLIFFLPNLFDYPLVDNAKTNVTNALRCVNSILNNVDNLLKTVDKRFMPVKLLRLHVIPYTPGVLPIIYISKPLNNTPF